MTRLLVIAKAPVPGRVKTRLCPPATPDTAARIAAAAIADTIDAASGAAVAHRTLVLDGDIAVLHAAGVAVPAGWDVVAQHGTDLADRLAYAFADTAAPGVAAMLIGMDTPQVTPADMDAVATALTSADAVLAPAADGGWWCLALRDSAHAAALRGVPMSTEHTFADTRAALAARGLRVAVGATRRDVDTAADAHLVASSCAPHSHFTRAVARYLRAPHAPTANRRPTPAIPTTADRRPTTAAPATADRMTAPVARPTGVTA